MVPYTQKYNVWLVRNAVRQLKRKCVFRLYEFLPDGSLSYLKWSETPWDSKLSLPDVEISKENGQEVICWTFPESSRVDGVQILYEGVVHFDQLIGVWIQQGDQLRLDVTYVYINP